MFVIQECSICFEDFDNERNPHSHIFCRPCLDSLISSPSCPNCRTSYTAESIRKVVCTLQDQSESSTSAPTETESETLMWQAIKSAVETPDEYEQRKSLVTHNSSESVREAGMSAMEKKNLLVALEVLQMLVKTEQRNHTLNDRVDTARAVEESLCDRISMLEAQLSAKTGEKSASSHDMQLLLAQVRAIQTSVQLVKSDTSTIVRHLNTEPPAAPQPPAALQPIPLPQPRTLPQPSTPITPGAPPDHTRRASTASKPALLRKPSSQNPTNNSPPTPSVRIGPSPNGDRPPQYAQQPAQSQQQESFLLHARTPSMSGSGLLQMPRQLMSPPITPAAQASKSLFAQSSPNE
ncbi:hypothetical protein FRC10_002150 [Ceratobasidium sp. 414]|nr:hypothetical protein FRC10_002150 [Ceratobasidium sp. 414]